MNRRTPEVTRSDTDAPLDTRRSHLQHVLGGITGHGIAGLLLAGYLALAFSPFDWDPPRLVLNAATRDASGAVIFARPGVLRSERAPRLLPRAIRDGELVLHLQVRSLTSSQHGPARIVTISNGPALRNVTVAQEGPHLVLRVRKLASTPNGLPEYRVRNVFADTRWRTIEVALERKAVRICVNGERCLSENLQESPFRYWNEDFRLAIGNEVTGDRPWLGEISLARATVSGVATDLLSHRWLRRPRVYWAGPSRNVSVVRWDISSHPVDALLNWVCFLPVGFILPWLAWSKSSVWRSLVLFSCLSGGVELAQMGFAGRVCSGSDWTLNVAGGMCGFCFATTLAGRTRRPASRLTA